MSISYFPEAIIHLNVATASRVLSERAEEVGTATGSLHELEQLTGNYAALKEEHAGFKKEVEELCFELINLRSAKGDIQFHISSLARVKTKLLSSFPSAAELEIQRTRVDSVVSQLEGTTVKLAAEIESKTAIRTLLEASVSDLTEKQRALEVATTTLRQRNDDLALSLEQSNSNLRELKLQLSAVRESIDQAKSDLDRTKNELSAAKSEVETVQADLGRHRAELATIEELKRERSGHIGFSTIPYPR